MKFMRYRKIHNFQSMWAIDTVTSLDAKSPFPVGDILFVSKKWDMPFDVTAPVSGSGTWKDVWVACDSVIRNIQHFSSVKNNMYILGFKKMSNHKHCIIIANSPQIKLKKDIFTQFPRLLSWESCRPKKTSLPLKKT